VQNKEEIERVSYIRRSYIKANSSIRDIGFILQCLIRDRKPNKRLEKKRVGYTRLSSIRLIVVLEI
jgi:hypothetical protein